VQIIDKDDAKIIAAAIQGGVEVLFTVDFAVQNGISSLPSCLAGKIAVYSKHA